MRQAPWSRWSSVCLALFLPAVACGGNVTPPDPGASAGSAGSGGTSGGGGAGANGGNAPTSGSSGAGGDAGASGDAGAAGDAGAGGDAGASGDAGAGGDTGAAGDAGAGGDAGAAGDAGAGGDAGAAGAGAGGAGSGGAGGTVDVPDCPDVLPAVSPPLFCPPGEVLCNGACEPGESDTNCGECGVVCAAGETCSNGFCRVPAKEITFSTSSYDAADAFYRGMAADDGFNVYTVNDGYFAAPYTIVAAGGPGIAFAISGGALYRTKDKGVTWTALDGVLPAKKLSVDRRRKLLIAELQDGSRVGYASWGDGPPNPLPWPWSPGMDAASGAMWSAAKEGTTWSTFYSTNGTDVCRAGKGFTKNPLGELDSLGFGGISNGVAAQVECTSTLTSLRDPSVVTTAPPKSLFVDPSTVCKVGGMMKAGWARPDRFEAFVSSRDPQFYSCYSMRWVSREWVAGTAEWSPVPTVAPQLGGSVKTYGDALLFNTTHIRSITADGRALAALGWRACGPGGSDKPELYEVRANVLE